MKVGYDLDGILVPDMAYIDETVLGIRDKMNVPLFIPHHRWYLITGRPITDKDSLMQWVADFLGQNLPEMVFMYPGDTMGDWGEVSGYKASIITKLDLDLYFESSLKQTNRITQTLIEVFNNHKCRVVNWEMFLRTSINKVILE